MIFFFYPLYYILFVTLVPHGMGYHDLHNYLTNVASKP